MSLKLKAQKPLACTHKKCYAPHCQCPTRSTNLTIETSPANTRRKFLIDMGLIIITSIIGASILVTLAILAMKYITR